ncbi:chitin-binding protein [Amycolatopsis xylanica]|uniref:Chitin-binding protein n=1 Tax=Amycolatopsis xylanica TaxID=589385 RepID=A0A1H2UU93_9PSEU|nr:lytic polysaccharide monooxygenase auxiliary activity family 9 protein [Amycolatopsis xylanica]SDW59671.1 chitin-binding protein [Amycolatopsis xylanica]
MSLKRKLTAAAFGAGIVPLLMVAVPSAPAFAHGYISSPPSRQAQCAAGTPKCGEIKYEPQSVEGPKGLRSCSGGNARFAELDDNNKGWKVTSVGQSVTFTWKLTAAHRTSTWEYYVGGKRVGLVNDNNQVPPKTVSHKVNMGGVKGKQKLLAIWNIADTANAFYACVDLNIS